MRSAEPEDDIEVKHTRRYKKQDAGEFIFNASTCDNSKKQTLAAIVLFLELTPLLEGGAVRKGGGGTVQLPHILLSKRGQRYRRHRNPTAPLRGPVCALRKCGSFRIRKGEEGVCDWKAGWSPGGTEGRGIGKLNNRRSGASDMLSRDRAKLRFGTGTPRALSTEYQPARCGPVSPNKKFTVLGWLHFVGYSRYGTRTI